MTDAIKIVLHFDHQNNAYFLDDGNSETVTAAQNDQALSADNDVCFEIVERYTLASIPCFNWVKMLERYPLHQQGKLLRKNVELVFSMYYSEVIKPLKRMEDELCEVFHCRIITRCVRDYLLQEEHQPVEQGLRELLNVYRKLNHNRIDWGRMIAFGDYLPLDLYSKLLKVLRKVPNVPLEAYQYLRDELREYKTFLQTIDELKDQTCQHQVIL